MEESVSELTQYITFRLGGELFAINVSQVREILELSHITRVPTAPDYMRGVVNVRGKAIPVADLRLKFGLPKGTDTLQSRIIVMELALENESIVVGGIADSVHEVIELEQSQISAPPRMGVRWRSEVISGMARRGEEFLIILDLQMLFSLDDITNSIPAETAIEPVAAA